MNVCYFVYREENVMVYASQVLEYLQHLKEKPNVNEVGLVIFRHEKNMFKRDEVEERALKYVHWTKSFASMPLLSTFQLRLNAFRTRRFIRATYSKSDKVAVICRGELATYIASVAFRGYYNARILYDNRGLPVLESKVSYGDQWIHQLNRKKKYWCLRYAKDHCDMYNFVTNAMREFDIKNYNYKKDLPYTIIPTLHHHQSIDPNHLRELRLCENIKDGDLVISYVGATQAWQSADELVKIIDLIGNRYPAAKFLLLTNGKLEQLSRLGPDLRKRIIKKAVPHNEVPYYLAMTSFGIILRDDSIINRVAAPTKIAEYIANNISILYKGHIGVLDDLKKIDSSLQLIDINLNKNWLDSIGTARGKNVSESALQYFDMSRRQDDTLQMIEKSMSQPMEREE